MGKKRIIKKNVKKPTLTTSAISEKINDEVIAAALSSANQPVFLKVCRLCETKDGPFLNIFDPDMITAKKIEAVMPFMITENDDLPHKICFRCSAKVEELYEFIQKCTQSQHNLRKVLKSKAAIVTKPKHKDIWEEKLNQSNISNDDICDALIKKAMEGIKDIPFKPIPIEDEPVIKKTVKKTTEKDEVIDMDKSDNEICKKGVKLQINEPEYQSSKSLRSNIDINFAQEKNTQNLESMKEHLSVKEKSIPTKIILGESKTENPPVKTNTFSLSESTPDVKTFNIMDHVSMIKVNGVGILFQCKLCNRNFLKKEVVIAHVCAKNGPSKLQPKLTISTPPKIPSVKYINTRTSNELKPVNDKPISVDDDNEDDKPLKKKPKPKIGPASKVKRNDADRSDSNSSLNLEASESGSQSPVVQFPAMPSLNSRYKLMPGPNNTFTLVEEKSEKNTEEKAPTPEVIDISSTPPPITTQPRIGPKRIVNREKSVADPTPASISQPYPVGLFKTVPTTDAVNMKRSESPTVAPVKKQSYTIVQTGHPSKLVISSKPQTEELPKKRHRKAKHDSAESFSENLDDSTPSNNTEYFTFINVDPLLQPSYVLPTNNIIQESQISTSTSVQHKESVDKDLRYTCNMCDEKFSREKKLMSHIQSHYNKMDEEDKHRNNPRKRKK